MTAEMSKEIRKALIDKGLTQADIARELGVSKQAVCNVINGRAASKRVIKYLSDRLGLEENMEVQK